MRAKRLCCICLIGAMLLLALLCGCQKSNDEGETAGDNATEITLFADGKTDYTIVRPTDADAALNEAARTLWRTLNDKTGAGFVISSAERYRQEKMTNAIIVGGDVNPTSQEMRRQLRRDDYLICVRGNNLYLVGGSDAATVAAVEWFSETYLSGDAQTLTFAKNFEQLQNGEYPIQQFTIDGTSLGNYQLVYEADRYYAQERAAELRDLLTEVSGYTLDIVPDTADFETHEILVGNTNRPESREAIAAFASPNRYWGVSVRGGNPVLAFEGVRSGEATLAAVRAWLADREKMCDLAYDGFALSGNLEALDEELLARPDGTDLRVLHSNVLGTLGKKANDYTDEQRAELMADTYLLYYPDVLTLNELNPGANREMTNALVRLLSPYYTFVEAAYLDLYPDIEGQDANTTARLYSFPVAYRKDAGLRVLDAGFSYLPNHLYYHGCAWTVFENADGNRFLAASVHLSQNIDDNKKVSTRWAQSVMEIVDVARARYGYLPLVLNGDWYFWQTGTYKSVYNYMIAQNLVDASEVAQAQYSVGCGTFHTIGTEERNRVEEDLVFLSPEWLRALSHKVLVDFYTTNGSDHYPVVVDLQFTAAATVDTIPKMTYLPEADGTLLLEVRDLSAITTNAHSGATYRPAFGNSKFYTYDTEEEQMYSLAIGGSASTVAYGGKTNLPLGPDAKYTVTYRATLSTVASGGLRISYATNQNSIGFYAYLNGKQACLAWGVRTSPGYSGYYTYTDEMLENGSAYGADGYAKFDLEINGYVISGYVNDVLLFREDIRTPSNAAADANIATDYMSDTLDLVWHEYTKANVEAGTRSTAISDLKIYAGLLHQS